MYVRLEGTVNTTHRQGFVHALLLSLLHLKNKRDSTINDIDQFQFPLISYLDPLELLAHVQINRYPNIVTVVM